MFQADCSAVRIRPARSPERSLIAPSTARCPVPGARWPVAVTATGVWRGRRVCFERAVADEYVKDARGASVLAS